MRKIELQVDQLEIGKEFNWREELINICRIREGGMNFDAMELAVSCIGAIRRADKVVILEEAEYGHLLARINEQNWLIADKAIIKFIKAIRGAETYTPDEPEVKAPTKI